VWECDVWVACQETVYHQAMVKDEIANHCLETILPLHCKSPRHAKCMCNENEQQKDNGAAAAVSNAVTM
jgi:hypothetical protein